jgi:hypothetical protein
MVTNGKRNRDDNPANDACDRPESVVGKQRLVCVIRFPFGYFEIVSVLLGRLRGQVVRVLLDRAMEQRLIRGLIWESSHFGSLRGIAPWFFERKRGREKVVFGVLPRQSFFIVRRPPSSDHSPACFHWLVKVNQWQPLFVESPCQH